MHRVASVLAGWIVRKPLAIGLAGLFLASASVWIIASQNAFDSDILNLLPADNPAVEGLKIFNSEFTQTRELAFLLTWKEPPADPDAYREIFLERLRSQPWVHRLLDAPPLETSGGRKTIHEILVPLLLNLPTDQFADALKDLSPEAIRSRIGRLAAQTAAGSPRARFELENDPVGLAARAAKPVWETVAISETFNLTSADGTAMIIPVITNQSELSAEACRATMRQVRHFIGEVKDELGPEGPDIGVTGRSAYVDEIEESMQRDIATTSLVSLFCVTALFWVGFRRLLPLIGIALLLALTAITTMACGTLYFEKLNIIAISFCSILFGLGDDFSLLLCQRFYQARSSGSNRDVRDRGFHQPLHAGNPVGGPHNRHRLPCTLLQRFERLRPIGSPGGVGSVLVRGADARLSLPFRRERPCVRRGVDRPGARLRPPMPHVAGSDSRLGGDHFPCSGGSQPRAMAEPSL